MIPYEIQQALQHIRSEADQLESTLKTFPDGRLSLLKNNQYYNPYHVQDGQRKYLTKKDLPLTIQLAQKEYLLARLADLQQILTLFSSPNAPSPSAPSHTELLLNNPHFRRYLSAATPLSDDLRTWAKAPYPSSPEFPEKKVFQTNSGTAVRSKSEVFIADALHFHCIPFRYECSFNAGDITLHPDFTIRHPHTGRMYLWEHLGLADDLRYMRNSFEKQRLYIANGYIPGINLLLTYETREYPLTPEAVEKVIRDHFL